MEAVLNDNRKQTKKQRGAFNIGAVIFGALFIYLIIVLVMYAMTDRVSTYMVTTGTLSANDSCTALALRSEQVVTAGESGSVSYFTQDGTKVSKDSFVCSIGDSSDAESQSTEQTDLTSDDLEQVRSLASAFSGAYRESDFQDVYDLKYSLESSVINNTDAASVSGTPVKAPSDGVVSYTVDGLESLTADDVTADDFDENAQPSTRLRTSSQVTAGDQLFRLITDDTWELMFPVSDRLYATLASRSTIKIRFAKDGITETGNLSLKDIDGTHYAVVTLYSGMVRYCDDRYLQIELVTNTVTGLKIPISSIVNKEFYIIPTSFEVAGGDDGETSGFLRRTIDENGNASTEFVEADLYEKTTTDSGLEVYYVDEDTFSAGDVIQLTDSSQTYTIGDAAVLEGVYCTNLGYAQFRKINILDQNEEYAIVDENTDYGISQYDYIVRDGMSVDESQILHKE